MQFNECLAFCYTSHLKSHDWVSAWEEGSIKSVWMRHSRF